MSIGAMNYIWANTPYPPALSYILMAIADVVNDTHDNRFFMSVPNLAKKAKCSERSIQRALATFEGDGWLIKVSDGGGRIPNEYSFQFINSAVPECHPLNDPAVPECHPSGDSSVTPAVTDDVSIPITQPNSKTNLELNTENSKFSEEVISIGAFFADSMVALGCKRPNVSKAWLTDIDRMIRRDGRTPEKIRIAIQWAHKDPFWSTNIHSPASLRKQYDRLRMQANSQSAKPAKGLDAVRASMEKELAKEPMRIEELHVTMERQSGMRELL